LEILKRAKEFQSGEGVSAFESEANVREEVNRRTHKAGYTDRDGQPKTSRQTSYGKGDNTAMRTNWKQWFSDKNPLPEKMLNVWPRDKNGQLIDD